MYKYSQRQKIEREIHIYTLALDEASIMFAFFSAILIRYNAIMNWADRKSGIYVSMILTSLLFEIIVYSVLDRRKATVISMDPVDNLIGVCKNRVVLALLTIMYFYATQRSVLTSRIVMGIFLFLSALYGYILRMLYRWIYIKRNGVPGNAKVYQLRLPVSNIRKEIDEISSGEYECVLVIPDRSNYEGAYKILRRLEKSGIRAFITLDSAGCWIRSGVVTDLENYAAIPACLRAERFTIFGVRYCVAKTEEAVRHVINHLDELKGKYICFSNVHTSVMAREHRDYAAVLNSAALVFPDGEPIATLERLKGFIDAERVAGPDFMAHMFSDTTDGRITHYFYGSTEENLKLLEENLTRKYPGIVIKGLYSPPFRDISPEEDQEDIDRINSSGADLVWIGLGAPKQEIWMKAHKDKINAVMLGVGAGFDFHAGSIERAPIWMQKIGLEWLYRLFKDPKRLFKRYIVTNVKFVWYILFGRS